MFNFIQKEINELLHRGFDRHLRLAVTGLSRSGKTAFITSLINQLLNINQIDNSHLPLFDAARQKTILGVKRIPQRDLSIPRFEYENNLRDLNQTPAQWPQSTKGVSETRLAIRYQPQSGLIRHFKNTETLYLDIFDYPGEWLLDLPLLELDFQQWSQSLQSVQQGKRYELSQRWLKEVEKLDLYAVANEQVLADLSKVYTNYLYQCKAVGLHFIQPGRFVLPGELDGAPVLQFFPLLHLNNTQWQDLYKSAAKNSYFVLLMQRYRYYRDHIVKGFYENHFAHFDRQIILADCLTPLNHSYQSFVDMQEGLNQLFHNFHYGKRTLLHRLFSSRIDKLLFVASKADHITSDQLPHLVSLMRQLVQKGGQHAEFEGIETEYSAIASIRATQQVNVTQNGQTFKALQGIRSRDKQFITLYPGAVPSKLPTPEFWQNHVFEFDQFEPQTLKHSGILPHLRMDTVLQFLLSDKLA